jgi:hypothetical protein
VGARSTSRRRRSAVVTGEKMLQREIGPHVGPGCGKVGELVGPRVRAVDEDDPAGRSPGGVEEFLEQQGTGVRQPVLGVSHPGVDLEGQADVRRDRKGLPEDEIPARLPAPPDGDVGPEGRVRLLPRHVGAHRKTSPVGQDRLVSDPPPGGGVPHGSPNRRDDLPGPRALVDQAVHDGFEAEDGVDRAARQLLVAVESLCGVRRPRRIHDDPLDARVAEQPPDVGCPVGAGLGPGFRDLVRSTPQVVGKAHREQLLEQPAASQGLAAILRPRLRADVEAQPGHVEGTAGEREGMGVVVDHAVLLRLDRCRGGVSTAAHAPAARTSRSFAAKASGSPVWPYSPPRKPP